MNEKDRYGPIVKQYEKAKTAQERMDCLFTFLCLIANNHLPHIERAQDGLNKKFKKLCWLVGAVLLAVLFSNEKSIAVIIAGLMKIF